MFQTQKARGYQVITEASIPLHAPWLNREGTFNVMPYNMPTFYSGPWFARPCPETPRHGFVESRKVANLQELLDVYVQTRAADPKGEVLIMRPLKGKVSAVATETGVTWGRGNDGVTGGKGKQFHIPCPAGEFTKAVTSWSGALAQDIKGSLFMEVVEDDGKPFVVQLRDGPKLEQSTGNFIPHKDFRVQNFLEPTGDDYEDLLAWEKKCKAAVHGTVVMGLTGLTSHLAVQAICHGLAVWTKTPKGQTPPSKGDILQPSREQPAALKAKDYRYLVKQMRKRLFIDRQSAVPLCIATLHSMPLWGREAHLLKLRAQAIILMARLLAAACLGEDRHFYRVGPGLSVEGGSKVNWKDLLGKDLPQSDAISRTYVQDKVLPRGVEALHQHMVNCEADFRTRGWGRGCGDSDCESCYPDGKRSFGYGGPKWAKSAEITKDLCAAIIAFKARPEKVTWDNVVACFNRGVMAAHNGGKALDKFTQWNHVDLCARAPQFGFLGKMAMEIATDLKGTLAKEKKDAEAVAGIFKAKVNKAKAWPWNKPFSNQIIQDPIRLEDLPLDDELKITTTTYKMTDLPDSEVAKALKNTYLPPAWYKAPPPTLEEFEALAEKGKAEFEAMAKSEALAAEAEAKADAALEAKDYAEAKKETL